MLNNRTLELRKRLCEALHSLALEFGPAFPVDRSKMHETRSIDASDFASCYPELKTLCHYTDAAGLEGILKSGTLWATNIAFLNDPEEFRFAQRVFERMVRVGEHALDQKLVGAFLNGLQTLGHDTEEHRVYIISFSAERDDLSQFRAYSDNARGYALEFEPRALIQALNSYISHDNSAYLTLRRVRYGTKELAEFHARAIDGLKSCISMSPHPEGSAEFLNEVRAFGMDFHDYLREAGVVFKQEGYESEKEYRAVLDIRALMLVLPLDLGEKLAVRFRGGIPVPYIPFQFLPEPQVQGYFVRRDATGGLTGITAGPGLDFEQVETGLFYLLRQNGLVGVEIHPSRCSYRPWT